MEKIKYEFHHAKLKKIGIPNYVIYDDELPNFIQTISTPNCVYLVSMMDEVYVTDKTYWMTQWIMSWKFPQGMAIDLNLFVQEYASFEEAYKVALDMQEIKPLCYA